MVEGACLSELQRLHVHHLHAGDILPGMQVIVLIQYL